MESVFAPAPGLYVADYVVTGVFLCFCLGIGVYYGYQTEKLKNLENYFLGNRRLHVLPVSLSLLVTYTSAISLIGLPGEIYAYGIRGMYAAVTTIAALVIGSFTFVPLFYPLRLISTYEYLQLRFKSRSVRTLGTLIGMLQTIAYMSVTLYTPALALQYVARFPLWLSIVVIGLTGTIYTAIGGIKAVVWTDVFQFVMVTIGLTAITIKGSLTIGQDNSILQIAYKGNRLDFFNFDPDPRVRHSMWGLFIGLIFTFLPNWCNQSSFQRIASVKSLGAAKRAVLIQSPVMVLFYGCLTYLGILLYVYYNVLECDPVRSGFLSNYSQLTPFFVLDVFRTLPGLSGIYISCLFSGSLSTLSSGMNSLAANTVEDIFGNTWKKFKLISQTFAAKAFVIFYGLVIVGLAYGINYISGNVIQVTFSVFGAVGGPLAGLFFLGGLVVRANWIGAIVGSISALVFNIWIAVGAQLYGKKPVKLQPNPTTGCYSVNITDTQNFSLGFNYSTINIFDTTTLEATTNATFTSAKSDFFLYNISYTWYGFIGFFLTLIIGTIVSYCTVRKQGQSVETRFIFPFCRKFWGLESDNSCMEEEMEQMNMLPSKNVSTE